MCLSASTMFAHLYTLIHIFINRNFTNMKIVFILSLFLTVSLSCNKNKECWECEVTNIDGSKWKDKSCTENLYYKQYADANGNALQTHCYKLE